MRRPTPFQISLAGVGVLCVLMLVVLWRRDQSSRMEANPLPEQREATTRRGPVSSDDPKAAGELPAVSPEMRALFAALVRALLDGNARDREAVLVFKDDEAMRRFLARASQAGLTVLDQLSALRAVRVRFGSLSGLQRELFENSSDYTDAGANALFGIPRPPAREDRANINQIPFGNDTLAFLGANGDRSAWGRGLTIGILDTGVAADGTFGTSRLRSVDIGLGLTPGSGSEDGHGTAVAALAAGASNDAPGVASNADLLSIRVTDSSGLSDLFTISRAIVTAVDAGAKIINVSLGGYATGNALEAAIGYAAEKGALIVAAAGNDQAAQLAWPAADPRVVSVGAIDKAEQQVSFSNSGEQLQLTAPGYGVQTAWLNGQRVTVDGTSASAPIVAGAIAAVMSQNPGFTPQQAADLLARTANDAGQPGTDPAYGRGVLNLATAMNAGNLNYVDTAVSSHYYDAANNQLDFVVQNRSGRAVTGMTLAVTTGTTSNTLIVPSLVAGESYVAKVPVNDVALKNGGSLTFTTQLSNPPSAVDQVPANNRRTSVLSAPKQ